MPGIQVFLDVDDLTDIGDLEVNVRGSRATLVFASRSYFASKNCLREFVCAMDAEAETTHNPVEEKSTMFVVCETERERGAITYDEARAELKGERDKVESWWKSTEDKDVTLLRRVDEQLEDWPLPVTRTLGIKWVRVLLPPPNAKRLKNRSLSRSLASAYTKLRASERDVLFLTKSELLKSVPEEGLHDRQCFIAVPKLGSTPSPESNSLSALSNELYYMPAPSWATRVENANRWQQIEDKLAILLRPKSLPSGRALSSKSSSPDVEVNIKWYRTKAFQQTSVMQIVEHLIDMTRHRNDPPVLPSVEHLSTKVKLPPESEASTVPHIYVSPNNPGALDFVYDELRHAFDGPTSLRIAYSHAEILDGLLPQPAAMAAKAAMASKALGLGRGSGRIPQLALIASRAAAKGGNTADGNVAHKDPSVLAKRLRAAQVANAAKAAQAAKAAEAANDDAECGGGGSASQAGDIAGTLGAGRPPPPMLAKAFGRGDAGKGSMRALGKGSTKSLGSLGRLFGLAAQQSMLSEAAAADLSESPKSPCVFVLVLNALTWTSPYKDKLAEELEAQLVAARDSGTSAPILMLHECANSTLGHAPVVDFGDFIRDTPDELKALNLYGPIAVSMQGSRQREGSLHDAAQMVVTMLTDAKFVAPTRRWSRALDPNYTTQAASGRSSGQGGRESGGGFCNELIFCDEVVDGIDNSKGSQVMISPILQRQMKLAEADQRRKAESHSALFSDEDLNKFVTIHPGDKSKVYVHAMESMDCVEARTAIWSVLTGLSWHRVGPEPPTALHHNHVDWATVSKAESSAASAASSSTAASAADNQSRRQLPLKELRHRELAQALTRRTEFHREELTRFGLSAVAMDRYVRTKDDEGGERICYQPKDPCPGELHAIEILEVEEFVGGQVVVGRGTQKFHFLNPQRPQTALAVLAPNSQLGRRQSMDRAADVVGYAISCALKRGLTPDAIPAPEPTVELSDVAAAFASSTTTSSAVSPPILDELRRLRGVWRAPTHHAASGAFVSTKSEMDLLLDESNKKVSEVGGTSHRLMLSHRGPRTAMMNAVSRVALGTRLGKAKVSLDLGNGGSSSSEQPSHSHRQLSHRQLTRARTGLGSDRLQKQSIQEEGAAGGEASGEAAEKDETWQQAWRRTKRSSAIEELIESEVQSISKQGPGRERRGGPKPTVSGCERTTAIF